MSNAQGPKTSGTGPIKIMTGGTFTTRLGDGKTEPGRRYFYLSEWLRNDFIRKVEIGFVFALPIIVSFFSKKLAFAVLGIEIGSYFLGAVVYEFDIWYNRIYQSEPEEIDIPNQPLTELEIILQRLQHFERKYWCTIETMYRWLEADVVPLQDNLDWMEIVALLNQLSLYVGKRFEEEKEIHQKE